MLFGSLRVRILADSTESVWRAMFLEIRDTVLSCPALHVITPWLCSFEPPKRPSAPAFILTHPINTHALPASSEMAVTRTCPFAWGTASIVSNSRRSWCTALLLQPPHSLVHAGQRVPCVVIGCCCTSRGNDSSGRAHTLPSPSCVCVACRRATSCCKVCSCSHRWRPATRPTSTSMQRCACWTSTAAAGA